MKNSVFEYRSCPLCGSKKFSTKYKRNYEIRRLKEDFFSARRARKKTVYEHNTFVRCNNCDLVYVNPILNRIFVSELYKKSKFNYAPEIQNLNKSYGFYLRKAEKYVGAKERILDIGTGNGFFLLEALNQGYGEVYGVEPSEHAIGLADIKVKKKIIKDTFKAKQFKPNFFDIICFFHVIDHVIDPSDFFRFCYTYLKKGGIILCISHNVEALSAKIMGERSPIFDIEHTQLFSKKTIEKITRKNKFKPLEIFDVVNTYTLGYWLNATPIPFFVKSRLERFFKAMNLFDKKVTIKPGNLGIIAQKC